MRKNSRTPGGKLLGSADASNPKVLSPPFFPLQRWGPIWVGFEMIEGFLANFEERIGEAVLYRIIWLP